MSRRDDDGPNVKLPSVEEVALLDVEIDGMEGAYERLLTLGAELGLSRLKMAAICSTIGANHYMAIGVPQERAAGVMHALYTFRREVGQPKQHLLVPELPDEGSPCICPKFLGPHSTVLCSPLDDSLGGKS